MNFLFDPKPAFFHFYLVFINFDLDASMEHTVSSNDIMRVYEELNFPQIRILLNCVKGISLLVTYIVSQSA